MEYAAPNLNRRLFEAKMIHSEYIIFSVLNTVLSGQFLLCFVSKGINVHFSSAFNITDFMGKLDTETTLKYPRGA